MNADTGRWAQVREAVAAAVQYGLLFGFAAIAAAISAHGLTGFARASMGLRGAWPYLLWGALDGAAGLCAVLLMRRAARGEPALAPRLAVWILVAASSAFNWSHAPHHPAAREAFGLMPLVAAMLFEFSLRETRHAARPADRRLTGLQWLHPGEMIRVQLRLASDETMTAEGAAYRARTELAARRLYQLRQAMDVSERRHRSGRRRVRRAERRAQAALAHEAFADDEAAASVLRQVQVLTLARQLARLDYTTQDAAQAALAALITPARANRSPSRLISPARTVSTSPGDPAVNGRLREPGLGDALGTVPPAQHDSNGHNPRISPASGHPGAARPIRQREAVSGVLADHDEALIAAAKRIVAEARLRGTRLCQADLAAQVRAQGHGVANERLRWLSAVSGLEPGKDPR